MRGSTCILTVTLALAACSPGTSADNGGASGNEAAEANIDYAQTVSADQLPPDFAKLPMKEFMGHVMQFAGDNVWKWQGFINDEKGEHDLAPKTEKDWEEAESGALTLAELTNVLLMPGRRVDDPKWDEAVAGVRKLALEAADASEKHDNEALFRIGGELDEACDNCHRQFIPDFVGPPAGAL